MPLPPGGFAECSGTAPFLFIHGIGSLIGLVLFLGIKALLLIFKLPEPTAFTIFAFGDFTSRFLIVKSGCLGVMLMVIFLGCFVSACKKTNTTSTCFTPFAINWG